MSVSKPTDARITAALTALGAVVLAAAGFFTITTPGEQRCRDELSDSKLECAQKVASADADAVRKISALESQVSVLTYKTQALKDARDACQVALDDLSARKSRQPESVVAAYKALGVADDALNEEGLAPADP